MMKSVCRSFSILKPWVPTTSKICPYASLFIDMEKAEVPYRAAAILYSMNALHDMENSSCVQEKPLSFASNEVSKASASSTLKLNTSLSL